MDGTARRLGAEFLGTFVLVFVGCGAAILDAGNGGIDLLGVAIAFGIAVDGDRSTRSGRCPAGTSTRGDDRAGHRPTFPLVDVIAYIVTQVVAATVAALVLFGVASGQKRLLRQGLGLRVERLRQALARRRHGAARRLQPRRRPAHRDRAHAVFLYVIIGATDVRAPAAIRRNRHRLHLMIVHLVAIPVSNTSVNPARSTGPAIIQHGWALASALGVLARADRRRPHCRRRATELIVGRARGVARRAARRT